jgi:Tfp pilus assembly protein PilF
MSQVEIMQGGDGITEGKLRLQRILTMNPDHPEANYLMGTVCEVQGEVDRALNYYKKAAGLLLEIGMN